MRPAHVLAFAGVTALSLSALAGCGGDDKADASNAVKVTASDDKCEVAKKDLTAGKTTFKVTNKGGKPNEFEILKSDGKILSERENIGPGTTVDFVVNLPAGAYKALCSAGQTGKGPTQDLTVSGTGAATGADPRLTQAAADYKTYVTQKVDDTLAKTREFVAAVKAGDVAKAKELYAPSRVGWETIEPVAEKFGDIDPKVDAREADLKPDEKATWGGWHYLEKSLWKDGKAKGNDKIADRLLADLETLKSRLPGLTLDPVNDMAGGAKELLDEVATGKVTGEEEAFSHTDLVDFKANVDGAEKVYTLLKPVVQEKDAALAKELDDNFAAVQTLLKKHENGDTYVSYDKVGKADRKELADAVNALGEPLSKLGGVVAK